MTNIRYAQINIGDFLSGVMQMDAAEIGAYTMMIFAHYQSGVDGLPDDDERLRKITRTSWKVWKRIKDTVLEKFYLENGHWKHERVVSELTKINNKNKPKPQQENDTCKEEGFPKVAQVQPLSDFQLKNKSLKNNNSQNTNLESRIYNQNIKEKIDKKEKVYWFEGGVIKLNRKDYELWLDRYGGTDSQFMDFLTDRDKWLQDQSPQVRKNWFTSTGNYIGKLVTA